MTITKEKLQQHIIQFPDELTIEEVIERLIMLEKIEQRLQESQEGKTLEEADLKEEMQKWFE